MDRYPFMGEIIQKAETALTQVNAQMTRYRALETMDEEGYNPVKELIELSKELKSHDIRDTELEFKIHTKLLEYYSAAPKKQMALDVQSQQQVVVMPVSYSHMYEGRDLSPCKPQLIDIIPTQTALEELMGDDPATSHTDT